MDSTGSVSAVEGALERLGKQRGELEEMWAARKLRLDLCLRLRLFERDALEVSFIYFSLFKFKYIKDEVKFIKFSKELAFLNNYKLPRIYQVSVTPSTFF